MDKKCFWLYLIAFARCQELNFDEDFSDISSQQLRALFTSYCLMFDIDTEKTEECEYTFSAECDYMLYEIFNKTGLNDDLKENFDNFMLEFLI